VIGPPRRALAPIGIGAILIGITYPPFHLVAPSFVVLAPAVLLVRQCAREEDPRGAFHMGFWYGAATQAVLLYWIAFALWHFTPLAALGYIATVALEALWSGVLFWFVVRMRQRLPAVPLAVVFPIAWTAVEWAVAHQGDIRFPWLGLGTSLADAPILIQWADVAGARGVTLWLAWCNVLIVEALLPPAGVRRASVRRLAPVGLTIALALAYGGWRERTLPERDVGVIGLVQPNEQFWEKWEPARENQVVAQLVAVSRALDRPTAVSLLVWPEAAIPGYFIDHPQWDSTIAQFVRSEGVPLLTGGLDATPELRTWAYFNAAFFFDSRGRRSPYPVYHKHYLVPVVERVPFIPPRWIHLEWFGGFGRGDQFPVYRIPEGRFGVLICYESAFEDLPRIYRREGADFLVNITNDTWFGHTSAPYQHASHLVLRAIESRMGIARAANSGISEFVDPMGHVTDATRLGTEAAVRGFLRTSDVTTFYARVGDWVGTLVVLSALAGAATLLIPRG
jgi:apolipoprotein N-acyltransferase